MAIHLVYFFSTVISQIADTNDITEFPSTRVCARVCVCIPGLRSHGRSQRKWSLFSIPLAPLISLPSRHPFGFSTLYDLFKFSARLNLPGAPAALLHVRQVALCAPRFRSRGPFLFPQRESHGLPRHISERLIGELILKVGQKTNVISCCNENEPRWLELQTCCCSNSWRTDSLPVRAARTP